MKQLSVWHVEECRKSPECERWKAVWVPFTHSVKQLHFSQINQRGDRSSCSSLKRNILNIYMLICQTHLCRATTIKTNSTAKRIGNYSLKSTVEWIISNYPRVSLLRWAESFLSLSPWQEWNWHNKYTVLKVSRPCGPIWMFDLPTQSIPTTQVNSSIFWS